MKLISVFWNKHTTKQFLTTEKIKPWSRCS